jgi:hypothetical protein
MNTELNIMQGFSTLSPAAQARVLTYLASVFDENSRPAPRQQQQAPQQQQPQTPRRAPRTDDNGDGAAHLAQILAPNLGGASNNAPFPLPANTRVDRDGR